MFVLVQKSLAAASEGFSGLCLYPGGFIRVDFSSAFAGLDFYSARITSDHAIIKFYSDSGTVEVTSEDLVFGRVLLDKLEYIKIETIGGSYFTLFSEVFDPRGNLLGSVKTENICNLSLIREKSENPILSSLEKEPDKINSYEFKNLLVGDGSRKKGFFFCTVCFVFGAVSGLATTKMLKY